MDRERVFRRRRPMRQWMMRITAYSERLLEDAKELDWPVSTLEQQRNWIGRSEGADVVFAVKGKSEKYSCIHYPSGYALRCNLYGACT